MEDSDQDCGGSSSESDYDGDGYYDFSDDDTDGNVRLHPLLEGDMQRLQRVCSEHALSFRVMKGITDMTLSIYISTSFLERGTAAAWKLNHGEPVTVCISLDRNVYLDTSSFQKVEVFQASGPSRGGVIPQLLNIAKSFCQSSLRELSNKIVSDAVSKHKNIEYADVLSLVEMGFLESEARSALSACNGSREDAANFLLEQKTESDCCGCANWTSSDLTPSTDDGKKPEKIEPISPCSNKETPSLENGFLVQFFQYMSQRLLTLNKFCPICDNTHDMFGTAMLKPSICHRELCIFSFTTLGLMCDVADSINTHYQVTDLLIRLTHSAATSGRHDLILTPYPAFVDPQKPNELAMHEKCKNTGLLRLVLNQMPEPTDLFKYNVEDLQRELDKRHHLCFPLLRWIIQSNRSYIVALPEEKQIKAMGTRHQFLMRSMPPLEEKQFIERRRRYGSTFAFHGSPIENWHSIIREGLIVASGTKKQLNGAAYGSGIYLSPKLLLSMSYSGQRKYPIGNRKRAFQDKDDDKSSDVTDSESLSQGQQPYLQGELHCIALCEVIKDKLNTHRESNIWTCTESANVCTRFFFVYDQVNNPPSMAQQDICTTDSTMNSQFQLAVEDALYWSESLS